MRAVFFFLSLAAVTAPAVAAGQSLARRVTGVEDGWVRLSYNTRPGVEICDQGIRMGRHRMMWRSRGWDDEPRNCRAGTAEVELRVRDGRVRDVDILYRERDRTEGAVDLGVVPPVEAAELFLEVARGTGGGSGEEDALLPAVIADVEEIWRGLMALARDRGSDEDVRTSALFWVSQEAAQVVTEGIAEVALDEEEEQEVREAAVFALSQRPDVEGVPILMDVARTAQNAETRESAMFWLAQSGDERVLTFFEDILLGRGGG